MTDPYDREERIAIRMDSGMSERRAIELTDAEQPPSSSMDKGMFAPRPPDERRTIAG